MSRGMTKEEEFEAWLQARGNPDKVSESDWKAIAHLYAGFLSGLEARIRHTDANAAQEIRTFLKHSSIEQVAALYKDR